MKQLISSLIILSTIMLSCNISTTATPPVTTVPPVFTLPPVDTLVSTEQLQPTDTVQPTDTLQPVEAVTPEVSATPITANLTCHELSLYLDPGMASGYNCEIVPGSTEGMEMYPEYTQLTLQGYVLADKFHTPRISVFPVARYSEILPDFIPGQVVELQTLADGGAMGDYLPFLPVFNAAQVFHAQYQVLPFAIGNGIRYLTEYAQDFTTVNNTDLIYTYQGLSSDGQYWVSVILPINNPILPADAISPPGGLSWEELSNNYAAYITDMINQLNSQPSESYSPTLAALDELVSSISIQP
jgi:hypothetical protein